MYSPKGSPSDLLLYYVLIDSVYSCPVLGATVVMRMSIEGFLEKHEIQSSALRCQKCIPLCVGFVLRRFSGDVVSGSDKLALT